MRPDYSRPTLWEAELHKEIGGYFRCRIIYPNGRADWISTYTLYEGWSQYPCWNHDGYKRLSTTAKDAVRRMKAYDKREGRVTRFVCNI